MELEQLLKEVDHKSYPAYKSLKGRYPFPSYVLSIDHVQGDPFAAPSSVSLHISREKHGFPKDSYEEYHRRVRLSDFLLRSFAKAIARYDKQAGGSGKSGVISVSRPKQEILERSALTIDPKTGMLIVRLLVGFPAAGRTTLAMELKKILMDYLPRAAKESLYYSAVQKTELEKWLSLADDQKAVRDRLSDLGLVAFVANGSILPRRSGVDDRPMEKAVSFSSPKELELTIDLPGGRSIKGMGIKKGITLIVGGGYHGKSTLLKALERGVYDHIPGDGREMVITEPTAMKLRAEDGRSIKETDISPFIKNLPNGKDTTNFSTEDASGSTSQAACTLEALMAGSNTLLIDEDTSATNFMVRDDLMQRVVLRDKEPITPFLYRMRQLFDEKAISTVLVAGSSGAFFSESDCIIQMDEYRPLDITEETKKLIKAENIERVKAPGELPELEDKRIPLPGKALNDNNKRVKVKSQGTNALSLGHESIEIRFVEQLVDQEQTNLLGVLLRYMEEELFDGKKTLPECVDILWELLSEKGMAAIVNKGELPGNLAMVRRQELLAMINRYRGLNLKKGHKGNI
ncbi:MAG: ABC-ATPase domain-containing protein [Lachnospiraceae bacterium]|nr:ABC-ATPase domain-containing protein [Lachnospiraceae bacterium]